MKNELQRFRVYLGLQIFVVLAVMVLFRVVADRSVAATIAGSLFVLLPPLLMGLEWKHAGFRHGPWFVAVLQFWILFALPILGLRVFNWGVPFEQQSILGVTGPDLHHWSTRSYLVMMIATVITRWWGGTKAR